MAKVYLSSTLLDLKPERQAVTDWLVAAGFQPVHSYVADSETVRNSCLDDVAGCELYILIVGHRYGFQPTKRNPKHRSITELEFNKARKAKIPCFAFLRTSVPDVAQSDINDPARYALVQAFRTEVQEALRPAEFKDMTEFVHALGAAMTRHVLSLLERRDAKAPAYEQRIAELESELRSAREVAVERVLTEPIDPGDAPAQAARASLLRGDTRPAEELLREQEDRAAASALQGRQDAARLAREIAALATGRNSSEALAALERVVSYLPDDYRAHGELGEALVIVGRTSEALAAYRKALAIGETLAAHDPANTEWQRDLSVSHNKIGDVLVAQGALPAALEAYQASLDIRKRLAAHDPANTQWQRDLSVSHNKIGDVLVAQGDLEAALAAFRTGLAIRETLAARDPANTQWQRDLSVSHDKIGDVLVAQGDLEAALAAFRTGLAIAETLAARDPANTEWQRDLSVSHNKIGDVLVAQGDLEAALAAFRTGLAIAETLAARDPANTEWQRDLSVSHNKIGDVLVAQGDLEAALAAFRTGLAIRETLAARDPANTEWQRDLSVSHNKIGDVLVAQGDLEAALAAFRTGLAIRETLAARDPANTQWQRDLVVSNVKLQEASGEIAYARKAFDIASALDAAGKLAPRDAWMIEDLRKRAGG